MQLTESIKLNALSRTYLKLSFKSLIRAADWDGHFGNQFKSRDWGRT